MDDPFELARFEAAQAGIWPQALAELRAGAKRGHWMWFIFPQIAGLGTSAMARTYAIGSAAEARAYLAHPVLGARLRQAATALLPHAGRPAAAILGGIDAVKLRSSLTLFAHVGGADEPFGEVLAAFFDGPDPATLSRID